MAESVQIDRDALEALADYVADDLRQSLGPESEYLEDAVREAYEVLDQ